MPALTREQWDANEALRDALRTALNSSPLKEAIEILVYAGLPATTGILGTLEANALLNTRREGYFEFYRGLQSLTQLPITPERVASPEPWEHIPLRPIPAPRKPKK